MALTDLIDSVTGVVITGAAYTASTVEAAAPYVRYIPYVATLVDAAAAAYDISHDDYEAAEYKLTDVVVTGVISTVAPPGIGGTMAVVIYTGIGGSESL